MSAKEFIAQFEPDAQIVFWRAFHFPWPWPEGMRESMTRYLKPPLLRSAGCVSTNGKPLRAGSLN